MGLVLNRREGERLRIKTAEGVVIWVEVVEVRGHRARLDILAPRAVHVVREEVLLADEERERERKGVTS